MEMIGKGVTEFLQDKSLMMRAILGVTGAYVLGYGCKSALKLFFHFLSVRLMTPKLVRETSRIPINKSYKLPGHLYKRVFTKISQDDIFKGVILKPELEMQLRIVSNTVINRKKHFAPFRNLLFHGPPGTGKTLFAKQLAKKSGLDFAILTGADIAPLGSLAVHELHKIFDWAESSKNGILIFVDEADAFLRRRTGDELISENLRNAINAFLYRTGTPSTKFMVVLATNAPQLLDEAIQDRIGICHLI
jgi:ATPase family AAA domain-containing protein 3A/B